MNRWKKLINGVLYPPLWLIMILIVISAVGLTFVFVRQGTSHPVSIALYVISFYTLSVLCLALVRHLPDWFRRGKDKAYELKYTKLYLTDPEFKTQLTLYGSLGINLLYVGTNAVSAAIYGSMWFVIFAVYYAILAVMRFLLARHIRKKGVGTDRLSELLRARLCAVILVNINLLLSGAVLMMVYLDRGFEYPGFLIYVAALYSFWMMSSAIVDLVKYRKYNSPVLTCAKSVKFAAALVSMLTLETAMFAQFGTDMSTDSQKLMIMITGAGIALILVVLSAYTIAKTTSEIHEIKKEATNEQRQR